MKLMLKNLSMAIMMSGMITVSYTHLDVYKRQLYTGTHCVEHFN